MTLELHRTGCLVKFRDKPSDGDVYIRNNKIERIVRESDTIDEKKFRNFSDSFRIPILN